MVSDPGADLLRGLAEMTASFLEKWAQNMDRAGYLRHTTAKVDDCILSFQWFLEPILGQASEPGPAAFANLVQDRAWAEKVIQTARLLRLTPTETRICQFIQASKSGKDMAGALNISLGTVNTHRKNIRKKLGLLGRDQNLFSFLGRAAPAGMPGGLCGQGRRRGPVRAPANLGLQLWISSSPGQPGPGPRYVPPSPAMQTYFSVV